MANEGETLAVDTIKFWRGTGVEPSSTVVGKMFDVAPITDGRPFKARAISTRLYSGDKKIQQKNIKRKSKLRQ